MLLCFLSREVTRGPRSRDSRSMPRAPWRRNPLPPPSRTGARLRRRPARVRPRAPEVAPAQHELLLLAPCLLRRRGQRGGRVVAARKQVTQRDEEETILGVKGGRFGRQARGAGELLEAGGSDGGGRAGEQHGEAEQGSSGAGEQGSSAANLSRGAPASMRPCRSVDWRR